MTGPGKVDFVGIDTDDTGDGAAMARRFDLAAAGFSLACDIGTAPSSTLWSSFGGQCLPVTAFYDAQGKVVDFVGGMLTQEQLQQHINQLRCRRGSGRCIQTRPPLSFRSFRSGPTSC